MSPPQNQSRPQSSNKRGGRRSRGRAARGRGRGYHSGSGRVQQQQHHEAHKHTAEVTDAIHNTELNSLHCIVCTNAIDYCTIYENCSHDEGDLVCWKCALSLRHMMKDKQCCVCKTESEHLIFSHKKPLQDGFSAYNLKQLTYDPEWNIYLSKPSMLPHIKSLFNVFCKKCNQAFSSMHHLKAHLRHQHNLFYCDLCLEHRKVFLKDQKLYSKEQLKHHIEHGEDDTRNGRIDGHPECLFCHKRFYNDDEIFFHMYHSHERCHLCEAKGHKFEFFKNYPMLQIHFEQEHFPCRYPQCLERHFVVFDNQLSLNHHILTNHSRELSRKEKDKLKNITPSEFFNSSADSQNSMADSEQNRRLNQYQDIDSEHIRFMNLNGKNVYLADHHRNTRHSIVSHQRDEIKKKNDHDKKNSSNTITYRPQRARGAFSSHRVRGRQSDDHAASNTTADSNDDHDATKQKKMMQLSERIRSHLGEDKFDTFKKLSLQFQQGAIMATEYYEEFYNLFGNAEDKFFDDLIDTMPSKDAQRAQALSFARRNYHTKEAKQFREMRKNSPSLQEANRTATKAQQKKKREAAKKEAEKLSEEWPSLGGVDIGPPSWGGVQNNTKKRRPKKKKPAEEFPVLGGGDGAVGVPLVAPPQQTHWTDNINAHVKVRGQGKKNKRRRR